MVLNVKWNAYHGYNKQLLCIYENEATRSCTTRDSAIVKTTIFLYRTSAHGAKLGADAEENGHRAI